MTYRFLFSFVLGVYFTTSAAFAGGYPSTDSASNSNSYPSEAYNTSANSFSPLSFDSGSSDDMNHDDHMMSDDALTGWSFFGDVRLDSNYVFRGKTQSDDRPALSLTLGTEGTISAQDKFYGTLWLSNIDIRHIDQNGAEDGGARLETDVTIGVAGERGLFHYDVGYVAYLYPDQEAGQDLTASEVFVKLGYENFTFSVYVLADAEAAGSDFGDTSIYALDYDLPLPQDWGLHFHYGFHEFASDQNVGHDYSIAVSKSIFRLAVMDTDGIYPRFSSQESDDDIRVVAGIGYEF